MNIVIHGINIKAVYFFLATFVVCGCVLIAVFDPTEAGPMFAGILGGILFSVTFGLMACSAIGCGFGNDPNFFQMYNTERLYGFNAESSILAPQIIAVLSVLMVLKWRFNLRVIIVVGLLCVGLFYARSSQVLFIVPLLIATWFLHHRLFGRLGAMVLLGYVLSSLLIPLLITFLVSYISQTEGLVFMGRDLKADILASALIRFASVDAGWNLFLENWVGGVGFERTQVQQRIALLLPQYAKFGVDNYPLARGMEFGAIILVVWVIGFIRMVKMTPKLPTRPQRALCTFFLLLAAMGPFSTGYLGVYYYVVPVVFAFVSIQQAVRYGVGSIPAVSRNTLAVGPSQKRYGI